jgi:hypothetical protein
LIFCRVSNAQKKPKNKPPAAPNRSQLHNHLLAMAASFFFFFFPSSLSIFNSYSFSLSVVLHVFVSVSDRPLLVLGRGVK